MRNIKTLLLILIVFLIQTVILSRIRFMGANVSLVIPVMMCVVILEDEFRRAAVISIISAVMAGALCGRDFIATALFLTYASVIVFALRSKPVHAGNAIKTVIYTFLVSIIMEMLFFALKNLTVNAEELVQTLISVAVRNAFPAAVINSVMAAVIYPALKRFMYREEEKKLLIGELV